MFSPVSVGAGPFHSAGTSHILDLRVQFARRIVDLALAFQGPDRSNAVWFGRAVRSKTEATEWTMSKRLEGKTALVTGATSNIGRAIAEAFAAEGAHVVVSGRSAGRGKEVVDRIRTRGGRADFVQADLDGSAAASQALARDATRVLGGRIDVLVNNAGIYPGRRHSGHRREDLRPGLRGQREGAVLPHRGVAPAMAEAGSGAIINLGSWIARLGIPHGALYSSTKGAVETLTRAWAAEFGPQGVRVNAISPGVVVTPAPGEVHPGEIMMKGTPAGRVGPPMPSRTPPSTSPVTSRLSFTASCLTSTAAALRWPSSPADPRYRPGRG